MFTLYRRRISIKPLIVCNNVRNILTMKPDESKIILCHKRWDIRVYNYYNYYCFIYVHVEAKRFFALVRSSHALLMSM